METGSRGEPVGLARVPEGNFPAATPSVELGARPIGAMASDVDFIAALPWKRASQANSLRAADADEPHKPPSKFRQPLVRRTAGPSCAARLAGERRPPLAMAAVRRDAARKAKYCAPRKRGHKRAKAVRGVADRLLGVVSEMIETGRTFVPKRQSKARA